MLIAFLIPLFRTSLSQDLYYVSDAQALCLDGTRGSYYFAEGYGTGSNNYIFHFEGGAWIEGLNQQQLLYSAYQRYFLVINSDLKHHQVAPSSIVQNKNTQDSFQEIKIEIQIFIIGILLISIIVMGQVFKNIIKGHQGHKSNPESYEENLLYFRGEKIVKSIINEFYQKISAANVVIISGCSAGGLAAYYWIDYFREILPNTVQVLGVPDSGIFIDMKSIDGSQNFKIQLNLIINLVNQETNNPNKECVQSNPQEIWKCFFAQYLTRYIQVPIFIVNSLYDSASIQSLLGIRCAKSSYSLQTCTEKEKNYIEQMHQNIYTVISGRSFVYGDTGSFAPSCLEHCFLQTSYYTSQQWVIPYQSGITLQQSLGHWLSSLNIQRDDNHIDVVDWPENKGCSNI